MNSKPLITSAHNPRVKNAVKLRDRKARHRQGCTIVDGVRELQRALAANVAIVELFVCPELCRAEGQELVKQLDGQTQVCQVSSGIFRKLAFGERAEGMVAIVRPPRLQLDQWPVPGNPLIAVLESVEKPGNLGAVARSADAAGLSALIIADGGTDAFNPHAIRASLGAIFGLPVFQTSSRQALEWLQSRGLRIFTASVGAPQRYTEADFCPGSAIVLGSEVQGLSPTWHATGITPIRLPMRGVGDSLNVSTAAAVLFYEALRQRGQA